MRNIDRNMLFMKGFRDGAGFYSIKYPKQPDYLEGYESGRIEYNKAAAEFKQKHGLPEPNIIRALEKEKKEKSKEHKLNPVVTEAITQLMEGLPKADLTHGQYNRHMFLEIVVLNKGAAVDQEDIQRYANMTDKEFFTIKDEFIKKNVVKEETNMFGVILYSLQLT